MKKYLGVKIVSAEKCYGLDNKCVDPNSEHCGREVDGYKVLYEDGYVSWSPKEVFEIAYKEVGNFDYLKTIDVHPNGNWNFMSQEYSISDCCDDSCDNTCESIN